MDAGSSSDDTLIGNGLRNIIAGGKGHDILFGKSGSDRLVGDEGHDDLNGNLGNDVLLGGLGDDDLVGGAGRDQFKFDIGERFNQSKIGIDRVTDFLSGVDKIVLSWTTFTRINQFSFASVKTLSKAKDSSALVTYVRNMGGLFYNQNESMPGFGSGGQFADLRDDSSLTASDFIVVNGFTT